MESLKSSPIEIIGYPFGSSAALHRSRYAPGILQNLLADGLLADGAITSWRTAHVPERIVSGHSNLINHRQDIVHAVTSLGSEIAHTHLSGAKPITVGGDHSQGFSTVKATLLSQLCQKIQSGELQVHGGDTARTEIVDAISQALKAPSYHGAVAKVIDEAIDAGVIDKEAAQQAISDIHVIWFDSHADYNTAAISGSHNFHGMALAAAAGEEVGDIESKLGKHLHLPPQNIVLIASRDLDEPEEVLLEERGVRVIRMGYIVNAEEEAQGNAPLIKRTLPDIVKGLMSEVPERKWIMSLDVDGIDALEVPGTGTPIGRGSDRFNYRGESPTGPSAAAAFEAFRGIAHDPRVLAIDITEASTGKGRNINPVGEGGRTLETTALLLNAVLGRDVEEAKEAWKHGPNQQKLSELLSVALGQERIEGARNRPR